MDTLCEQSLFSSRRRVGNGRVHVYPYKKILHCPVQHEGLKLKELQWDMDESIKPNSIAVVIEPQKSEDVQISWTPEGTQHPEGFEEEVDSSSYESDTDKSIAETRNSSYNDEAEQPVKNRPVSSLPEGIGNTRFGGYKTKRYKCLYCPQVGPLPGRRTMQRAMFHRAHCNYNPNRDQHYEEFRSKTSSRQINRPRAPPAASTTCWVVVDGNKYSCRDCVDNGETSKVWKYKVSVKNHCAVKCKYRDTSTKTKPTFVDNDEISDNSGRTDRSQINRPRAPPAASTTCWVVVDGNKYACRDCVDNGETSKVWKYKVSVKNHCAVKCKYRDTSTKTKPTFVDNNEISDNSGRTDRSQINRPRAPPAASTTCWVVVDGNKYACRDCVDNGETSKVWKYKVSVKNHCAVKCKYRVTSTKTKPTFVDNDEISDNSGRTDRSQDDPNRIKTGQH